MTENVISAEGPGLDTVIIKLENGNYDEMEAAMENIGATKQLFDGSQRVGRYGRLKNLKVKLSRGSLTIDGSWCKFYHGNNLEHLTWEQSVEVFRSLQNTLQISLESAIVVRVDFGVNLLTKRKPARYFQHLGEHRKLKRSVCFDSIYWQNGEKTKTILAYDKMAEASRKSLIPEAYKGKQVLRIETRYKRRYLKAQIGKDLKVFQLITQKFQQWLWVELKQHYQDLSKIGDVNLAHLKSISPKDFTDLLALLYLKTVGQVFVMEMFNQLVEQKAFRNPAKNVSAARNRILDLGKLVNPIGTPEPIKELDRKFEALKTLTSTNPSRRFLIGSKRTPEIVSTE